MAHEKFQGRVIGVWQVIDSFVKPDVPQTIILNFCSTTRPVTPTRRHVRKEREGQTKNAYWLRLKTLGEVASSEAVPVAL
jgi:hypothetical protein